MSCFFNQWDAFPTTHNNMLPSTSLYESCHTCECVTSHIKKSRYTCECVASRTGWRRCRGCLELQVSFRKRVPNLRVLLQKITYNDKAAYDATPPCMNELLHQLAAVNESCLYQWVMSQWRSHVPVIESCLRMRESVASRMNGLLHQLAALHTRLGTYSSDCRVDFLALQKKKPKRSIEYIYTYIHIYMFICVSAQHSFFIVHGVAHAQCVIASVYLSVLVGLALQLFDSLARQPHLEKLAPDIYLHLRWSDL